MRVPPRLLAVVLFLVLGLVALVVAGLLDWIVGVLFLTMEFLGGFLREVCHRRKDRRHPPKRDHHPTAAPPHPARTRRGFARVLGRARPRRGRSADRAPSADPGPRPKLLVPVTFDDPVLLDFALEECAGRRAELILLFLRPMAIIPMGPNPLPGLAEDDEARSLFDRVAQEAGRLGIPMRALYETTVDRPATIGEVARACRADVVVVGTSRGGRLARLLARDPNPSLRRLLPKQASLLIRAS